MKSRHNQVGATRMKRLLEKHYARAGRPSWSTMSLDIAADYGIKVTDDTLKRAHMGLTDPGNATADLLVGLARYYGFDLADYGDDVSRPLYNLLSQAAFVGGPPPDGGSEQEQPMSRWTVEPRSRNVVPLVRGTRKAA